MSNIFKEFWERYKEADKENTAKTYRSLLNKLSEWLGREGIGKEGFDHKDVRDYLEQSDYSAKTQDDIIGCLKNFAKWYKDNKIDWDNFQVAKKNEQRMNGIINMIRPNVPKRQTRKALRVKEIRELLDGLRARDGGYLFLSCYFGMRAGEWHRIKEIDFDELEMKILGEKDVTERILPFTEEVSKVLKKAKDRGWIGRSYGSIWKALKNRRHLLDGVKLTPTSGRHTFRSEMGRRINDEGILDTLLGHGNNKIRNVYDDPAYEHIQEAMRKKHYLKDFEIPEVLRV